MAELPAGPDRNDLTPSGLERLRAGDSTIGSLLDATYRQRMLRFCLGYLGEAAEAEDAVQEIFCKLLDPRVSPESFRPWLYKVARNHCLNRLRDRGRRKRSPARGDVSPPDEPTGNLTRLIRQELRSRIAHLVAALPTLDRELLRLRYTEELSRTEMAQVLDLPEADIKARLFQALQNLREHTSLLDGQR
jgi:RNA polymerase sigma factor (sigma-70 family)